MDLHTETNAHTHIHMHTQTCTHAHTRGNFFPHSGPSFLISKMGDNSLCLARGSFELRDIAVNFANCKELGKTLLR